MYSVQNKIRVPRNIMYNQYISTCIIGWNFVSDSQESETQTFSLANNKLKF